jgi:hypothetical protein
MKTDRKPVVQKTALLKKFPGKGGWTYIEIPEIAPDTHSPFGWVLVSGTLDSVTLPVTRLQPMGNGFLFLSVNAALRKQLQKEAGDEVKLVLYLESETETSRIQLIECLKEAPDAYQNFLKLPEFTQNAYVHLVHGANGLEEKSKKIVALIKKLEKQ